MVSAKWVLDADHYILHLGDTVFKLMGFKDNKETEYIFERYMELGDCSSFASFGCVSACVACKCAAMWDSQNGFAEKVGGVKI